MFDDDEGTEGGKAGVAEKGYANGGASTREHAQPLLNGGEARVPPP